MYKSDSFQVDGRKLKKEFSWGGVVTVKSFIILAGDDLLLTLNEFLFN